MTTSGALLHVLLALAAVIACGRLLGLLCRRVGQPPVIGEILAGIVLGPSLLGRIAPDVSGFLLPESVAPSLSMIAHLGIVLYMFLIGLELNGEILRDRAQATIATALASIAVPFAAGAMLAIWLSPRLSSGDVSLTAFALFLGVAMSITAFPVLARILGDRKMAQTELGVMALTCAAINDAAAWCLLAFVVGVAQAQMGDAVWVGLLTVAYMAFMFLVVRPLIPRVLARLGNGEPSREVTALVFLAVLLSALATEAIGIHAIFGAFLLGAIIPHDSPLAGALVRRTEDLVAVLLLPAFFAFTGMRTEIGLVSGWENWLICGAIIIVATAGKFGGTLVAARLTGMDWRNASALGVLMNTRGLMELIVLNIGLDLGVISPTLFAMMVIMALVTTIATTPVLRGLIGETSVIPAVSREAVPPRVSTPVT